MEFSPRTTWRSSFGADEDRNQTVLTQGMAHASGWRSPFGVAEDRNDLETIGVDSETDMMVALQGDQDHSPVPSDGLEPPVSWRLASGATEDRNHVVAGPIVDKFSMAVALQGGRGSQRRHRDGQGLDHGEMAVAL
ncbi:hypothetical protein ACIQUL_16515 [Streptomyces sp. NPDC090303]|uniref:hypothetical protein n=1 Tax=Streptomyces sp. NPDC090303 TaxID=3365960 RepID=UPI00382EFA22